MTRPRPDNRARQPAAGNPPPPCGCTTRTYTRRAAVHDTIAYLGVLQQAGLTGAELASAAQYALAQWSEWPATAACPLHAKAG
jgi:hypothetical protein